MGPKEEALLVHYVYSRDTGGSRVECHSRLAAKFLFDKFVHRQLLLPHTW